MSIYSLISTSVADTLHRKDATLANAVGTLLRSMNPKIRTGPGELP